MTSQPSDSALAEAFREVTHRIDAPLIIAIWDRARELDAEKGGDVADHEYQRGVCVHCGMEVWMGGECSGPRGATPPAQAAEAAERVRCALWENQWDTFDAMARAAIAAMQAGAK